MAADDGTETVRLERRVEDLERLVRDLVALTAELAVHAAESRGRDAGRIRELLERFQPEPRRDSGA